VQVGHAATAAAAAQVLAQLNCRTVRAEALNEIRGVEDALMLAPAADGDERYLGANELAERAAEASFPCIAVAGAHAASGLSPATSPIFRIDEFAAEAIAELLGMHSLGKAEDEHVGVVAAEGVAAAAER
jgi:hypothetical protein